MIARWKLRKTWPNYDARHPARTLGAQFDAVRTTGSLLGRTFHFRFHTCCAVGSGVLVVGRHNSRRTTEEFGYASKSTSKRRRAAAGRAIFNLLLLPRIVALRPPPRQRSSAIAASLEQSTGDGSPPQNWHVTISATSRAHALEVCALQHGSSSASSLVCGKLAIYASRTPRMGSMGRPSR